MVKSLRVEEPLSFKLEIRSPKLETMFEIRRRGGNPPLLRVRHLPCPAIAATRFFGFLSANLDPQNEILLAQRFVGFDVVCADRSGRSYELPRIFNVPDCFTEGFNNGTYALCENEGAVFEIEAFRIFLFVHCRLFRASNFGFRA
jgi:hypothetical protein